MYIIVSKISVFLNTVFREFRINFRKEKVVRLLTFCPLLHLLKRGNLSFNLFLIFNYYINKNKNIFNYNIYLKFLIFCKLRSLQKKIQKVSEKRWFYNNKTYGENITGVTLF